jgi:hypothetical protein
VYVPLERFLSMPEDQRCKECQAKLIELQAGETK